MLATPVIFYSVWSLVVRGPSGHTRWLAVRFAFVGSGFFLAGALVSHVALFPWVWRALTDFVIEGTRPDVPLQLPLSLYATLLLTCGLTLQLPATVLLFARVGALTPGMLVRNVGRAAVLMVTLAAVLTPTGDPITLMVVSLPLFAAYGLSMLLAWCFGRSVYVGSPQT